MIVRHRRCAHCLDVYRYLLTGHGCTDATNDPQYCPVCKAAVLEALRAVPRKYERVWIPTTEVDLPTLLRWEAEWDAERQEVGLNVRRVAFPLFNLTTGERTRQGYVRSRAGQAAHYLYQYWPGREAEAEIKVEVERNLTTGETRPWRDTSSE